MDLDWIEDGFYSRANETLEHIAQTGDRYPFLETFKAGLDGALSNLIQLDVSAHCRGVGLDDL